MIILILVLLSVCWRHTELGVGIFIGAVAEMVGEALRDRSKRHGESTSSSRV